MFQSGLCDIQDFSFLLNFLGLRVFLVFEKSFEKVLLALDGISSQSFVAYYGLACYKIVRSDISTNLFQRLLTLIGYPSRASNALQWYEHNQCVSYRSFVIGLLLILKSAFFGELLGLPCVSPQVSQFNLQFNLIDKLYRQGVGPTQFVFLLEPKLVFYPYQVSQAMLSNL